MPVSGAILGHNRQKHEGSARFIAIQLTASGNPSLENFFGKICVKPLDSANSKGVGYYSKNWAAHNCSRALKKCLLLVFAEVFESYRMDFKQIEEERPR